MSTSGIGSASKIQADFMKLLITQLQNQNPLEPMDNSEMASQLAQFSALQQLESINSSFGTMNSNFESMNLNFADVLASSNRSYANSLLDRRVSYLLDNKITGEVEKKIGAVSEVSTNSDGEPYLFVNRHVLGLDDIGDSLIGKDISYYIDGGEGQKLTHGKITGYDRDDAGKETLIIDGHSVDVKDIVTESLVNQEVSHLSIDELTGKEVTVTSMINNIWNDADDHLNFSAGRYIKLENITSVVE